MAVRVTKEIDSLGINRYFARNLIDERLNICHVIDWIIVEITAGLRSVPELIALRI